MQNTPSKRSGWEGQTGFHMREKRNINQKGIISIALALKIKANLFRELHPGAPNKTGQHVIRSSTQISSFTERDSLYQSKICIVLFSDKHKALSSQGSAHMEFICRGGTSVGLRPSP
jgi:hypothetical protein